MQLKNQLIFAFAATFLLLNGQSTEAQNRFDPSDNIRSTLTDQADIPSRQSFSNQINGKSDFRHSFSDSRQTQPPQQPDNHIPTQSGSSGSPSSIFNNGLRGTSDSGVHSSSGQSSGSQSILNSQSATNRATNQPYDAQPLPPRPPITSGRTETTIQSNPTIISGTNAGTYPRRENPATQSVPIRQLNPNRVVQGVPDSQPARSEPIVDNNPLAPAGQTPRIPTNISVGSGVITSSYSSPQQQQVQRNSSIQRNTQPNNQSNNQSVGKLLDRYDVTSSNQALPGIPVDLESLMKTTPLRFRMAMVQQYWETFFDWSTLQNRRMHSGWLAKMPAPRSQSDQALLQTAKSMAQNEIVAAEIQLSRSQSKLQQLARSTNEQLLPLPMDRPLITKYNTHYDWYATRNMIPPKLKGINEMLPRTHELITSRSATVNQAEGARNQATQAYNGGQVALGDLLEAGRVWRSAMQGFTSTVVSYNQAISDYALTITPPQKPISAIVSMLVAKPKPSNEVAIQNSVLAQSQPSGGQQNFALGNRPGQQANQQFGLSRPVPDNSAPERVAQQNQPFRANPAAGNNNASLSQSSFGQQNQRQNQLQNPGGLNPAGRTNDSFTSQSNANTQSQPQNSAQPPRQPRRQPQQQPNGSFRAPGSGGQNNSGNFNSQFRQPARQGNRSTSESSNNGQFGGGSFGG